MRIQDIEAIAVRLRKYRLTPEDALAVAEPLAASAESPVRVLPADLASLMRPRRPPTAPDTAGAERRLILRRYVECRFPTQSGEQREHLIEHHPADLPALKSAVQYRAKKAGIPWRVAVVDATHALVTLG